MPTAQNLLQDLIASYPQDLASANQANDSRYQELLGLYRALGQRAGGTYDQIDQASAGIGNVARQRIDQNATQQFSNAQQRLIARGLGNSTLINSAQRGVAGDREQQQQQVDESQARLQIGNLQGRLGADFDASQLLGGVTERRTDAAPDLGQYMALLQAAGQSGVGAPRRKVTIGPTGPRGGSFRSVGGSAPRVSSGRTGVTSFGRSRVGTSNYGGSY